MAHEAAIRATGVNLLRRLLKDVALNLALASKTRLAIGPDPAEAKRVRRDHFPSRQ